MMRRTTVFDNQHISVDDRMSAYHRIRLECFRTCVIQQTWQSFNARAYTCMFGYAHVYTHSDISLRIITHRYLVRITCASKIHIHGCIHSRSRMPWNLPGGVKVYLSIILLPVHLDLSLSLYMHVYKVIISAMSGDARECQGVVFLWFLNCPSGREYFPKY